MPNSSRPAQNPKTKHGKQSQNENKTEKQT